MNLADQLRRDVVGEVKFDDYTRQLYARDASMYAITPLGAGPARASPGRRSGRASCSTCPGT
jgi:hypothetical protein